MEGKTVLYVEDEDAVWFLFETAVQNAKINVDFHRVADGEQAIEFLGTAQPDLIVLDLNLPRKDGWQLLEEIHSQQRLRNIPVVIFTSSALPADMKRSLEMGALAYVTKPFSYDAFLEAVNTICSYVPTA